MLPTIKIVANKIEKLNKPPPNNNQKNNHQINVKNNKMYHVEYFISEICAS